MYITIKNKDFTSAQNLASILYVMKKEDLLKIAKRLDFWISPNERAPRRKAHYALRITH